MSGQQMKFSANIHKAKYVERNILSVFKDCSDLAGTTQGRDQEYMQTTICFPNALCRKTRNGTKNETNTQNVINISLMYFRTNVDFQSIDMVQEHKPSFIKYLDICAADMSGL